MNMARRWASLPALLGFCASAILLMQTQAQAQQIQPVTDQMLAEPADSDWLMWRRTLNGWGYSPLSQITPENVPQLESVWTHPIGPGFQEGAPLIHDGRMYVPSASDYIQAFDATSGELLWEYKRRFPPGINGGTNRNLAFWGHTVINAGGDNTLYALDARSGELVWETPILEASLPAIASSGPIVANGKVFTGRQCQAEAGMASCIITAHDASNGRELWRTSTIAQPGEPGDESWGDVPLEERVHVGNWMVPSYDVELNRLLVGTSVTMPAPKFLLGGSDKAHLYHNSTLALDADTGEIIWYYQHLIDHWDLDHTFERLLVDTAVAPDPEAVPWINPRLQTGEQRKVVTGVPGKSGLVYTLDRETGEFLWARETVKQNVISHIDGATGEVEVNPDVVFSAKDQSLYTCPSSVGGKNWQAGAYSPRSNAMFMPLFNLCMDAYSTAGPGEWEPSLQYGFQFRNVREVEGNDNVGALWAISAETGRTLWHQQQRAGIMSVVATGGGVVFAGDIAGYFKAYDENSGDILWETWLEAPVSGYPVSFAVDGRQYLAVTTGPSLLASFVGNITPEVLEGQQPGGKVHVFALP